MWWERGVALKEDVKVEEMAHWLRVPVLLQGPRVWFPTPMSPPHLTPSPQDPKSSSVSSSGLHCTYVSRLMHVHKNKDKS